MQAMGSVLGQRDDEEGKLLVRRHVRLRGASPYARVPRL